MSSNYLNYELSKELHDLGVVFEDYDHWEYPDGTTAQQKEFRLVEPIGAPSTAQLIDEINKVGGCLFQLHFRHSNPMKDYGWIATYLSDEIAHDDNCATTCLGKALIALVTAERSEAKERQ
jgi:hypothetical protein